MSLHQSFHVDPDYQPRLEKLGLSNLNAFFEFKDGQNLHKETLAAHRSRITFELPGGPRVYLKRYSRTPKITQLKNWFAAGKKIAVADRDRLPAEILHQHKIKTPKIIAWGAEWNGFFETRSFLLTEEIPGGVSLEKQLPECLINLHPFEQVKERRDFLHRLALWIRQFHNIGLRHRDLYLAHIFLDKEGDFVLIDLHRCFHPKLLADRFLIKDLAQLYYSAPGKLISRADRLRFYLSYIGKEKLTPSNRKQIRQIKRKAWRMADHDIRHGRAVPFTQ